MKYIIFLFFIFYIANIESIFIHSQNCMAIRNTGLRLLISSNYKYYKTKIIHCNNLLKNKLDSIQEIIQIKCSEYYHLTEEERIIIETIFDIIL